MNSKQSDRRRFLKDGAVLAGLAVGAIRSASGQEVRGETSAIPPGDAKDLAPYGERSRFVTSVRERTEITPIFGMTLNDGAIVSPLQDSMGIITPNSLFYVSSRDPGPYTPPTDIDPRQHRLLIHGMVDRPLIFTMEELKRLPSVSRIYFIECMANTTPTLGRWEYDTVQERHGKMSCAEWTGVPLSVLLRDAGVQKGARWVMAESMDAVKYWMNYPLEKAMDDILLAYGQNGEPLRPQNGFPLRLVAPGWEGERQVKWLRRIKVADQPYVSQTESSLNPRLRPDGKAAWFNCEMGPKSVITFPASGGPRLAGPGYYQITGLAWSGGGAIRRVEVSTDGGRSWKDARLQDPVLRLAFTRFYLDWNWNGEEMITQSRSTDEQGNVQPSLEQFAETWGVSVDYFRKTTASIAHNNTIQRWKVSRDGSVHNAVWEDYLSR